MSEQKIKVLFVDDEQANLTAYKRNFRRDLEVFEAISAEEAFNLLATETIDVIVSDQRMPNTTGVEFLSQVKERSPATMRILVTGYSDIEAVISAINHAGVFNYLTKPYTPEELLSQIKQAHDVCVTKRAMERLEIQYSFLFNLNQDPCLLIGANGTLLDINPAGLRLFATDKNSILTQGIDSITKDKRDLLDKIFANSDSITGPAFSIELVGGLERKFDADIMARAVETPGVRESLFFVQIQLPRENILDGVRAA